MLGVSKERRGERLVSISLEAAVPADHFYRYLDAKLDLSFVHDSVADRYAERGRPGIAPATPTNTYSAAQIRSGVAGGTVDAIGRPEVAVRRVARKSGDCT